MPHANSRFALVADIGGTNARFALTDCAANEVTLVEPRSLPGDRFDHLQQAVEAYLAEVGAQPRRAALAVASPVDGDEIRLTNRTWSFNRKQLQSRLGLDELHILNDFGAVAWAVPSLARPDRVVLQGPTRTRLRGPISVIGPGTGLGVGLLVSTDDGQWQVVETEGGHATFAPVGDEEELIARWMLARFDRVSNERVLCGEGLSHIAAALDGADADPNPLSDDRLRDPADIVAAALAGQDPLARRTLERYCAVLGSVAGDLALTHGAHTLVIAGGIVPQFIPFLRQSAFHERFLDKGRMAGRLQAVSVEVIVHAQPGLLGAAVALRRVPQGDLDRSAPAA